MADIDQIPSMAEWEKAEEEEIKITDTESPFGASTKILPVFEVAKIQAEQKSGDNYKTGFEIFDSVIGGGVTDGDLVVISGITGHGKTTLAQTFSYYFGRIAIPQLWFSYEMEIQHLVEKFKAMGLDENFLAYAPLRTASGNLEWIDYKISEGITKYKTKIIFIDHLGFLTPGIDPKATTVPDRLQENYSVYLGSLVRQLKTLAVKKKIIIFLLAHVRKVKGQEKIDLEHIAHSAGIAQEADFVFMVERIRLDEGKRKVTKDFTDSWGGEIFGKESRIWLMKNRRTGVSKFVKCEMSGGVLTPLTEIYGLSSGEQPLVETIGVDDDDK